MVGELPAGSVVRLGRRRLFVVHVLTKWIGAGAPPVHPSRNARG